MAVKRQKKGIKGKSGQNVPAFIAAFIFVILLPLVHVKATIEPVIYPRFTIMAFGLIVLTLGLWIFQNNQKFKLTLQFLPFVFFLILFLLVTLISLFYSVNPREGVPDFLKWFMVAVFVILLIGIFSNNKNAISIFLKSMLINASIALLIGFFQLYEVFGSLADPNAIYEVKGLMAHKNQFSISLFLLLPFVLMAGYHFEDLWRRISWVCAILLLFMLFVLQTRAVWIALFASSLAVIAVLLFSKDKDFLTFTKRMIRKPVVVIAAMIIIVSTTIIFVLDFHFLDKVIFRVVSVFDPEFTSNEWRLEMWDATLNLISDNLWFGVGAGNWKINIYPYYSEYLPSVYRHWRSPHNDYLWIASEKGLVGLGVYVLTFFSILILSLKNYFNAADRISRQDSLLLFAGFLGYMIISFFSFPAERVNHLVIIAVMVAITLTGQTGKNKSPDISVFNSRYFYIVLLALLYFPLHYGILCIRSEVNIAKAQVAYAKNDWQQLKLSADKGYSNYVPLEPKYSLPVVLYKGLAAMHFDKDLKAGIIEFEKAYEQHPNHITVINNVGSVYGIMGDFEKSAVYFQKTLEIFPHYELGLLNLAKAYFKQKDFEKAYQTILSCDPKSTNLEIVPLREELEKKMASDF